MPPLVLDGSGGISGVDGTASNPAIEGTDSNTGIFYPAADTVAIGTGGTEALRVNSAQNVGIGTSSPAQRLHISGGTSTALQISATGNASTGLRMGFASSSVDTYLSNTENGVLIFGTNNTERMRLDASGNLGIGTTSPTNTAGYQTIEVNGSSGGIVRASYSTSVKGYYFANSAGVTLGSETNDALMFRTNATERARITSGGLFWVNTTSDLGSLGGQVQIASGASRGIVQSVNANIRLQEYLVSGTSVGFISTNGTTTTYGTSSDYRLKHDIQPMQGALEKVIALKPVTYKWNIDDSDGEGFIAHELAEICPHAVTGEKDAVETYTDEDGNEQTRPVYQGIDASFLVATLTAAIQELNAKVEAQAAEIAALKGAA